MHQLPGLLDIFNRAPYKQRLHILLNQMLYRQMAVSKGCAAKSIQPRLICLDLYDHKIDSFRCRTDHPDIPNLY